MCVCLRLLLNYGETKPEEHTRNKTNVKNLLIYWLLFALAYGSNQYFNVVNVDDNNVRMRSGYMTR